MNNKKPIYLLILITILAFMVGFSYAYFVANVSGNKEASNQYMSAGSLRLVYESDESVTLSNAEPGDIETATFIVRNNGSLIVDGYDIFISKLLNQFINNEVVYSIACTSSDENPCSGKTETPIPTDESLLFSQGSIGAYVTHTYTLTIKFIDTGSLQDYNKGKSLSFKITIDLLEERFNSIVASEYNTCFLSYAYYITEITFENVINAPNNIVGEWNISEYQNGEIMAYMVDDIERSGYYKLYIQSNEEIYANVNCRNLFANFRNLKQINNIDLLNTSNVTDMSYMFSYCSKLNTLNISSFDTSKVTDMSGMFVSCNELDAVDVSRFNTSNVIDMSFMFAMCFDLLTLDLSNFDTSKSPNMRGMFYGCDNLTSVNISNHAFTSSLENYGSMFYQVPKSSIIAKDTTAQAYIDDAYNWSALSAKCWNDEEWCTPMVGE